MQPAAAVATANEGMSGAAWDPGRRSPGSRRRALLLFSRGIPGGGTRGSGSRAEELEGGGAGSRAEELVGSKGISGGGQLGEELRAECEELRARGREAVGRSGVLSSVEKTGEPPSADANPAGPTR